MLRKKISSIIFGTDTKAGRLFDVVLLWTIGLSIINITLDSIISIRIKLISILDSSEVLFTILFTIEYLLRIYCSKKPLKYIFSFWGLIDFLAIVPSYIGIFFLEGTQQFMMVRALRLLRIFRILKLVNYVKEASLLINAIKASSKKIIVFMGAIAVVALIMGTIMYTIERENPTFKDIPHGFYWAIVTITTVGYGDLVPVSNLGKFFSTISMLIGYSIIAVLTGIVSKEISNQKSNKRKNCPNCIKSCSKFSKFCNECGTKLDESG